MTPTAATATRDRLRIAIQKSGRLADPARALLAACGLSWRESRDRLFCYGEALPVDLLLVRDDDIPGLIADGVCDLGVVGRNVLNEQAAARANFGLSDAYARSARAGLRRLPADAGGAGRPGSGPARRNCRASASPPAIPAMLADWLEKQGVRASVVELSGSVEIAPQLGKADLICDLVSSGATLLANQLKPVETLLESEAVLAGPAQAFARTARRPRRDAAAPHRWRAASSRTASC